MKSPVQIYTLTIPAGQNRAFTVNGFFLRILAAGAGTECQINDSGVRIPIYPSFYTRSDEVISNLRFYNTSAADSVITYAVADVEAGDNVMASLAISGVVAVKFQKQLSEIQPRVVAANSFQTVASSAFPNAEKYVVVNEGSNVLYLGNGSTDAAAIAAGKYITLNPWDSIEMDIKGGFKIYSPNVAGLAKIMIFNGI